MRNGQKLQTARNAIGDTAGFYDEFTVAQTIEWNLQIPEQELRDALRSMVKTGCIVRVSLGRYRWTI